MLVTNSVFKICFELLPNVYLPFNLLRESGGNSEQLCTIFFSFQKVLVLLRYRRISGVVHPGRITLKCNSESFRARRVSHIDMFLRKRHSLDGNGFSICFYITSTAAVLLTK